MSSFTVANGVTDTTAKTVGNNDTGTIVSGGTLSAATAITWNAGSASPGVVIDNSGTISATTRGIDTSGSFTTGSFTFDNHVGAKLVAANNDAFRINTNISTGTINVDNSGFIVSGALDASNHIIAHASGQALDLAAIVSPTAVINITNHAGAVIAASGDDAIRPGAGNITISNDGLIDATASASRAINLNTASLSSLTSFHLTNNADGTIQSTGDAVRISAGTLTTTAGYNVAVDNAGTITTTGATGATNGQAIDFADLISTAGQIHITNQAGGLISAADADAIRAGVNTLVDNHGHIVSNNAAGDSGDDGVDFQGNSGGVLNNYSDGVIDGARHGITGDQAITITNAGSITGHLGSGINMDTPSLSMTTITNTGTIIGTGGYLGGDPTMPVDGDGIDVDGLLTLNNHGTIQATGVHVVDPGTLQVELQEAVTIGGGTINNYAGATITSFERAITVDDSGGGGGPNDSNGSNGGNAWAPTTIYNEGTIHGGNGEAISITDTFADTLTNKGVIEGSVALGGGDDIVNDFTGSTFTNTIDGGDGTDTINLMGAGIGTLAHAVNFEALDVQAGAWTVTDGESFSSGVTVAAGAQLQLGNGGSSGSLSGAVTDNGLFTIDHSDVFSFDFAISGTGVVDQAGNGTTILDTSSSYSGGTTIHHGTLDLAAIDAAGTGDITFEAGAQTLQVEQSALDHGHLDNTIDGFDVGDVIDLAGIGQAKLATLSADNLLTITGGKSGPISLQLDAHAFGSGENFQLTSDGHGGTKVSVVLDNQVDGNNGDNLLIANLFSPIGSFIDGKAGNDILIGGLHADVLNGGSGSDLLYGGVGADQFRFNGTDVGAGRHDTDTVFDLNFAKGDSLVLYDYEAGTFASSAAGHGAILVDTGEGHGSGAVVNSMTALVDLIDASSDVSAHRGGPLSNDLIVDVSQTNGSHETIVLSDQWHAYIASGGHLLA
jgi:autotransporter-associated beta strand protein